MKIRNWTKHQGYQKRGPKWIKLHASLLNEPDWITLPVVARAVLPALWLAASQQDTSGELPNDPEILAVLCHTSAFEIREALPYLRKSRFINECDRTVAGLATEVSQQTERETETELFKLERDIAPFTPGASETAPALSHTPESDSTATAHGGERGTYARLIWEAFNEKRGSDPDIAQMSSAEWDQICKWHSEGVPLRVVLQALEQCNGAVKARLLLYLQGPVSDEFARFRAAATL